MTSRLADIVAEFVTELADASVTVALGRRELHRNDSPPRVVFERVGGTIEMTREIGRQDVSGSTATRQLFQRNLTCRLHCWGVDEEQAEQLLHNSLVALRRAALGSVLVGEEVWAAEADTGDVDLGVEVIAEVGIQIPIVDAIQALREQPVTWPRTSTFGADTGACA